MLVIWNFNCKEMSWFQDKYLSGIQNVEREVTNDRSTPIQICHSYNCSTQPNNVQENDKIVSKHSGLVQQILQPGSHQKKTSKKHRFGFQVNVVGPWETSTLYAKANVETIYVTTQSASKTTQSPGGHMPTLSLFLRRLWTQTTE